MMTQPLTAAGLQSPLQWVMAGLFALLLLTAVYFDLRQRRIPNVLNVLLLVAGVAAALLGATRAASVLASVQGVGIGLLCWIVFYALGFLGAGDVKFFAASGAWLGPGLTWRAALLAALIGGVLAVVFLIRDSRLGSTLRTFALMPFLPSTRRIDVGELDRSAAMKQLPYAVAMAGGLAVAYLFPEIVGGR